MENHFYHIKWPPLNVTIFITHVRSLRNGCYANRSWFCDIASCISCVLSDWCERRAFPIELRNFSGRQPATGPARDGETQVVLPSLSSHLVTPVEIGPPCFAFTRYIVALCLTRPLFLPGHHIVPNIVDTRPEELYPRTIPRWNSLSPSVINSQTSEEFRALII